MGHIVIKTKRKTFKIFDESHFPLVINYAYDTEGGKVIKEYVLNLNSKGLCLNMEKKEFVKEGTENEK